MDPDVFADALKMTDGNDEEILKITKSQHNNFGHSLSINASSTWQKIFPSSSPATEEMGLKPWWERVWCLKKGVSGWKASALAIGVDESRVDSANTKDDILEVLISFLDKDLK
eukprot:1993382-Karenia_brevis.AAC.1